MKTKFLWAAVLTAAMNIAVQQPARAQQTERPARLLVRADDIGMNHASNMGVVGSCTDGIARSVELMVVTPWLPEAAAMLAANPGIDVGVHIAFTSEWAGIKWRPLTPCPSLVDELGYFHPFSSPTPSTPGLSLAQIAETIDITEMEAELRAQIELALKILPGRITHITGHMGWAVRPDIAQMAERVAADYSLPYSAEIRRLGLQRLPVGGFDTRAEQTADFLEALRALEPGKTYLYVEHPALDTPEMRAVGNPPAIDNVAADRQSVYDMFTSEEARSIIAEKGIELVSYGQLLREQR